MDLQLKQLIEKMDKIELMEGSVNAAIEMASKWVNKHNYTNFIDVYKMLAKEFPDLSVFDVLRVLKSDTIAAKLNPTTSKKAIALLSQIPAKPAAKGVALLGGGIGLATQKDEIGNYITAGNDSINKYTAKYKDPESKQSSSKYSADDLAELEAFIKQLEQRDDKDSNPKIQAIIKLYHEKYGTT